MTKSRLQRWLGLSGKAMRARSRRTLATAPAANRQTFILVEPEEFLLVHTHAFALKQDAERPVAETAALCSQATRSLAPFGVAWFGGLAHSRGIRCERPRRPASGRNRARPTGEAQHPGAPRAQLVFPEGRQRRHVQLRLGQRLLQPPVSSSMALSFCASDTIDVLRFQR